MLSYDITTFDDSIINRSVLESITIHKSIILHISIIIIAKYIIA